MLENEPITNPTNPELRRALAILQRDPKNVGAHIQAGVYYSQDKKFKDSVFHLKKAHAGDKKNLLILEKLCDVMIKARMGVQARKYARKMLGLKKKDPAVFNTNAKVSDANGDIQKALYWINNALELDPKNETYLISKANYLSQSGDIEASLDTHRKILEINPKSPDSWWPLAQLQRLEGEEASNTIKTIHSVIEQKPNQDTLRALHFAAGKIHQDNKEYSKAFEHFAKANLLHEKPITADRIIAANINIRETYSRDFLEQAKEQGNINYRPIYILGQTRSGTTLTESLCAAHSKVSAGGELQYLTDLGNRYEFFSTIENRYRNNIHNLSARDVQELGDEIIAKSSPLIRKGTRLTDKMPHNFLNIGMISVLYPHAQIIHCRRHPLDNCLSIFSNPMLDYHKEYKSNLETLGIYYRNYVQIMDYWKEICPIPIHEVYYEDLVTNTENVARQMIRHLGLEWEDRVMDRSGSQSAVKTLSVWQVRQPVFQTSKGKWRNFEKELEPLKSILADEIEQYETELAALDSGQEAKN